MITNETLKKARLAIQTHNEEQLAIYGEAHLLPCPFCYGVAKIRTTTFGDSMIDNFAIECENGHSLDYWNEDKSKTIAYWNDRHFY